jgi:hypothetical protein
MPPRSPFTNPACAPFPAEDFHSGGISFILILNTRKRKAVRKRKPGRFSAAKAVKANARERVGQPKPARVIDENKPKTGRKAKHKAKVEELMEGE